jgi:raffinose/stachyose/melibiose transport system permease protein
VVLPQLLPITATVAILLGVTIWNEFFIALIYLSGSRIETLPVALYTHFGDYGSQTVLFAGVAITVAPALAFYLFAQRRLIRGIATGIKG